MQGLALIYDYVSMDQFVITKLHSIQIKLSEKSRTKIFTGTPTGRDVTKPDAAGHRPMIFWL